MDRQRWLGLGLLALVALALAGYLATSHQSLVEALRSYLTPAAILGHPTAGGTRSAVTAGVAAHGAAAAPSAPPSLDPRHRSRRGRPSRMTT